MTHFSDFPTSQALETNRDKFSLSILDAVLLGGT